MPQGSSDDVCYQSRSFRKKNFFLLSGRHQESITQYRISTHIQSKIKNKRTLIDTNIISAVAEGSNMSGKERLEAAGIPVSPVAIIGPAAWDAIHGNKVHTTVNKMAKQLAFAARWFPSRLRNRSTGLVEGLDKVVSS